MQNEARDQARAVQQTSDLRWPAGHDRITDEHSACRGKRGREREEEKDVAGALRIDKGASREQKFRGRCRGGLAERKESARALLLRRLQTLTL
jgi:hypothetical protein